MGNALNRTSDVLQKFANDVAVLMKTQKIDYVVLNAGILKYPNVSFDVSMLDWF